MESNSSPAGIKKVRIISPTINVNEEALQSFCRRLRVAAYCRVSTKQEEQLNSYEVQKKYYTDKINSNAEWEFVGIFADKGITGTSVNKRDEFNKMIKLCKRNKIDFEICKKHGGLSALYKNVKATRNRRIFRRTGNTQYKVGCRVLYIHIRNDSAKRIRKYQRKRKVG